MIEVRLEKGREGRVDNSHVLGQIVDKRKVHTCYFAETGPETFEQVYSERLDGRYRLWRAGIERILWTFPSCGIEKPGFERVLWGA